MSLKQPDGEKCFENSQVHPLQLDLDDSKYFHSVPKTNRTIMIRHKRLVQIHLRILGKENKLPHYK